MHDRLEAPTVAALGATVWTCMDRPDLPKWGLVLFRSAIGIKRGPVGVESTQVGMGVVNMDPNRLGGGAHLNPFWSSEDRDPRAV